MVSLNPLLCPERPRALIALEDGTTMLGRSAGARGEVFGEIVFNTAMAGYQEIITDPSYAGQIVLFTYPQIGNYGVTEADEQAGEPALAGVVVKDLCYTPSNWRSGETLPAYLERHGVVGIEDVDTRTLTLKVRERGTMRAAISTVDLDPESLVARVQASPYISEHNWVADVSTLEAFAAEGEASGAPGASAPRRTYDVVALDCGEKQGILDELRKVGLNVTIVPWDTSAGAILALEPDGVFLSNGPGDPRELDLPQGVAEGLLGKVPLFGICLGHQMICAATGATIEKLPYGHHGGNQPVANLLSGMVEVTAQNHNYGLDFASLGPLDPELSGGFTEHEADLRAWVERKVAPVAVSPTFGRIRLTHVALNDGTPEGIQFLDVPAFSVQYHPEANPGPHDSHYLFESFRRLIAGEPDYLAIDVREGRPR